MPGPDPPRHLAIRVTRLDLSQRALLTWHQTMKSDALARSASDVVPRKGRQCPYIAAPLPQRMNGNRSTSSRERKSVR
jgi:hypothetical protein